MLRKKIQQQIEDALVRAGYPAINVLCTFPSSVEFGDYFTPVAMNLAKILGKPPLEIAQTIAKNLHDSTFFSKVEVVSPGFINMWIKTQTLLEYLGTHVNSHDTEVTKLFSGKKVIVEYSSPNIAKPFTIGHLRSTIIGDALAHILEAVGYTVFRDNHVGDWGTQFGKLIYAIKTWGNLEEIQKSDRPIRELVNLYVRFHTEAEKNPALEDEGRAWFNKLERNDQEARSIWQQCIDWSWKEFDLVYKKLDISFTENNGRGFGESYFEDKMLPVLSEIQKKLIPRGLYKSNDSAELIFFPNEKLPPLMVIKQDGSTLYSTRDLATDKFRITQNRYGEHIRIINEVGAEQTLYFKQLYEAEQLLGWVQKDQREHVKHGMYRFKDQKMSTRKGNVIWLEDVLEEAEKRAFQLIKHDANHAEKKAIASAVGIGAIKWNDLKRSPHLDIVFDWDDILNMQGNSGPYIQYTYVRCMSVINKSEKKIFTVDQVQHINSDEDLLLRKLVVWPEIIISSAKHLNPGYICTYLFELAQLFNLFYQKNQILNSSENELLLRLAITKSTAHTLKYGLALLGIKTIEKM